MRSFLFLDCFFDATLLFFLRRSMRTHFFKTTNTT